MLNAGPEKKTISTIEINNFLPKEKIMNIAGEEKVVEQQENHQSSVLKKLFSQRLFHKLSILTTDDNYPQYLISLICNKKKKIEKYEQQFNNIEKIICISTYSKAISSAIYT